MFQEDSHRNIRDRYERIRCNTGNAGRGGGAGYTSGTAGKRAGADI